MESSSTQLSIEIPNFNGPLEVLLDLAKSQKVDLAQISITKLADQFLDYIKNTHNLNLETASDFLLMAFRSCSFASLKSSSEISTCVNPLINSGNNSSTSSVVELPL